MPELVAAGRWVEGETAEADKREVETGWNGNVVKSVEGAKVHWGGGARIARRAPNQDNLG